MNKAAVAILPLVLLCGCSKSAPVGNTDYIEAKSISVYYQEYSPDFGVIEAHVRYTNKDHFLGYKPVRWTSDYQGTYVYGVEIAYDEVPVVRYFGNYTMMVE